MTQMHTTWREVDISAYVDGELEPAKQSAFEAALAQDRALQQKVKEMREVVALVRAIPLREPPRNYLLTPSMVAEKSGAEKSGAEKSPQRAHRRSTPLLFMRLATSLAAVAFVVTAGLTYMQRSISPTMVMNAPKAAEEMPAMEAPPAAVVATVVVQKEVEVMQVREPAAMPTATPSTEAVARAEKVVESEAVVEAPAAVPLTATPQPDAGIAAAEATTNAQELTETAPQEEMLALESAPAAEAQGVDEAERVTEGSTGAPPPAGESEWMAYDTAEPTTADQYSLVTGVPTQTSTPSWWLPGILGAVTLLLAGLTFWISRRR